MKATKGISTRMRNLMTAHIGKTYKYLYHGRNFLWTVTIKSLMGNTGYFITEVNDGTDVWQSNASYGEIKNDLKKELLVEI